MNGEINKTNISKQKPLVSILMNGYDAEKYLKEAIDSIYAQTYKNWEIIFIDNCSMDKTKEIVNLYDKKIKYYKTDKNIPIGAARNFGLQYCKGEYLAFLDTDDVWLPNKLTLQIEIMEKYKEYQFCYGGVIYINESSQEIKRELPQAVSGDIFAQQLKRYEINQQTVLIRNNISFSIDETLKHSPDFDLFMRLGSQYKCYVLKEYIVKYRIHANSLTSKNIAVWWLEMKYTLDNLFKNKALWEKYYKESQYGYAKVNYNRARYLISIGKKEEAVEILSKYKLLDIKYYLLYIISLFPSLIWNFIHKYK